MQLIVVRLGLCYFSDFPMNEELYPLLKAFPESREPMPPVTAANDPDPR